MTVIRRRRALLDRTQLPPMPPEIVDPTSVFNPGAALVDGVTQLLLRVQTRGRRTFLVPAAADDGLRFRVAERPSLLSGLTGWARAAGLTVHHVYDPRLTLLEGRLLAVTAVDTDRGCRLVLWRAAGEAAAGFAGLDRLEFIAAVGDRDTRNGVLFPERLGGCYALLERPNRPGDAGDPASGRTIVLSVSDDLERWREAGPVFSGRPHYWDEGIGSGPPPVRTAAGWLHVYHGIATHFRSVSIYQAGAVLLAGDDPTRVLARTADNFLEPRLPWELTGQVPNVVFPSGWTVEPLDAAGTAPPEARVRLYYGAADTLTALAVTSVGDLLAACEPCG